MIKDIADFQKVNKTYSLEGSIFIAKHLSVIYSADPATREKGKYWMHQLLNMMPSVQLLDMYVSEEIDRIFAKVQSEYIAARKNMGQPLPSELEAQLRNEPMPSQKSTQRSSGTGAKPKADASESKSNAATWWWVGGLTAATAVGVTTYFILSQNNTEPRKTISVAGQ